MTLPATSLVIFQRSATKKAKKKKSRNTGVTSGGKVDTSLGDGIYDLKNVKDEMGGHIQKFKEELHLKYSPTLTVGTIDKIYVTIDGKSSQLYEIAECTAQEKDFIIQPMIKGKNIEKQMIDGINNTGLDLRPRITDKTITIDKPISSTEYKTNMLNLTKASAEKCKAIVRKIRQHNLAQLKKLKSISKDDIKMLENQVDLLTEESNQSIENLVDNKRSELKI